MAKGLENAFKGKKLKQLALLSGPYVENYSESLVKEDGRAHISVDLRHGNRIFETYSSRQDLAEDIYRYVEGAAKYTKITTPLTIDFLLPKDKESLETPIREQFISNYAFDFDETSHELKKCLWHALGMLSVGAALLLISITFSATNASPDRWVEIVEEIVSIASWVFVWDAVDKYFFDRPALRKEALRKAQLAQAEIRFRLLAEEEEA